MIENQNKVKKVERQLEKDGYTNIHCQLVRDNGMIFLADDGACVDYPRCIIYADVEGEIKSIELL